MKSIFILANAHTFKYVDIMSIDDAEMFLGGSVDLFAHGENILIINKSNFSEVEHNLFFGYNIEIEKNFLFLIFCGNALICKSSDFGKTIEDIDMSLDSALEIYKFFSLNDVIDLSSKNKILIE